MGMGNNVKKITYHGKVTDLNKLDQFYTTKNTKKGKGDKKIHKYMYKHPTKQQIHL